MTQRTHSEPKAATTHPSRPAERAGGQPAREPHREKATPQATKTPTAEAFGSFEG